MPDHSDPTQPGYVPQAGGGGGFDYGHGAQFGADTYALYAAGQVYMPEVAGKFSDAASDLHWISGELSGMGAAIGHSAFDTVRQRADDVLDALGITATRIYDAAGALVQIADDFASTDGEAAGKFHDLLTENEATFADPPGRVDPPRPGDPQVYGPHATPDENDVDQILQDADIPDTLDEDGDGRLDEPGEG